MKEDVFAQISCVCEKPSDKLKQNLLIAKLEAYGFKRNFLRNMNS